LKQENRRLQREIAVLRQEQAFATTWSHPGCATFLNLKLLSRSLSLDRAVWQSSYLAFEPLVQNNYHSREEAGGAIVRQIEIWCNRQRRRLDARLPEPGDVRTAVA
jgi:hypothetical protein